MQTVSRQEHKFLMEHSEAVKLQGKLSEVLKLDEHSIDGGYTVRSLYFDTLNNRDFHEKNDGLFLRRKLRLRIYDVDDKLASLQMKQKQGIEQKKRSILISREHAMELTRGQYSCLLGYEGDFPAECFAVLSESVYIPRTVIQYRRTAFASTENNIRITFDSDISVTEACMDVFSPTLNLNPSFRSGEVVLEVKYNNFLLSYISDLLNSVNRSRMSISKYCLGRAASLSYLF